MLLRLLSTKYPVGLLLCCSIAGCGSGGGSDGENNGGQPTSTPQASSSTLATTSSAVASSISSNSSVSLSSIAPLSSAMAVSSSSAASSIIMAVSSSSVPASSSAPMSSSSASSSITAISSSSANSTSSNNSTSSSLSSSSSSSEPIFLPVTVDVLMHLDASDLVLSDGALVMSWAGASGTSITATQANMASAPIFVANSGDGRASVVFDGIDDYLQLSSNVFAADVTELTVFAVIKSDDYNAHIIGASANVNGLSNSGFGLGLAAAKPFFKAKSSTSGAWILAPNSPMAMEPQVLGAKLSNMGTQLVTACHSLAGAAPEPLNRPSSTIGRAFSEGDAFAGNVYELIVYRRALSDAEFLQVRNYLATRHNAYVAALDDTDNDGTLDACDTGAVYLKAPQLTLALESMSLTGGSLPNIIDAESATVFDPHTSASHVWHDSAPIVVKISLNGIYAIEQVHFWNYENSTGDFDTDALQLDFYTSDDSLIESLTFTPEEGFGDILAEDFRVNISGVSYVRATMSGTNNKAEFINLGFTAIPAE